MDGSATRLRNSPLDKTFGRRVFTGLCFTLVGGVLGVSWSVRAGIVPSTMLFWAPLLQVPAAVPAEEASAPESVQLAQRESRAINLLMYRDRDRERLLLHAENHLQEGDVATTLEYLQRILDFEEDLFVWRKSDQELVSVRSEASRLLQELASSDFARYERMVAADAEFLVKQAAEKQSLELYQSIVRKYFHTVQGFHATHWCATRWFDHGQFEMAARAWKSLETHPYHQSRVTKTMRVKRKLAEKLSRKSAPAPRPIVQVAENRTFPVAARMDVIPASATVAANRPAKSWQVFQGGQGRCETAAATTPFLNPDWSASYSDASAETVQKTISLWEEKQEKALCSRASALFPIVVEETVVFRDFSGIRAVDRATGEVRWKYRCQTSLKKEVDRLDNKHGRDGVRSSRSGTYIQLQADYAGNSVLGLLSSDGARVFAIDGMILNSASDVPKTSGDIDPRTCNRLIALPMDADSEKDPEPLWMIGGTGEAGESESALVGHFFRGPPLPIDGRLYAITEFRNQLNLVALEAETGKLLWKQGLAFADDNFEINHDRYPLACSIALGDGVLVCPTQTGLLVGVEAMTGTLLWSYCYAEELYENENHSWRDRFRKSFGSEGFPSTPKVQGHRVVLLPRQSDQFHCLDVRSGKRIWTAPREDAEFVAAVSGRFVLVVGNRYCRGLDLHSGQEQWSSRFGMPAGQGICAGGRYLLPLETGRIATIQIHSGREIGLSGWRSSKRFAETTGAPMADFTSRLGLPANPLPDDWRMGNLIPAGDRILACGPAGLIAFPQTGELLNHTVRNRLLEDPKDLPTRLLAAELHLNLGHWGPARNNLEKVLSTDSSADVRRQGEFLMRELLFRQLESEPNFAQPLLDELAHLVASPEDCGRFLMRKADFQIRTGDLLGAWQTAQALIDLDCRQPLPFPQNPQHEISAENYSARLMKHIRGVLKAQDLAAIDETVENRCQTLLQDGGEKAMLRFLALYEAWPQAAMVRERLAEQARDRGNFQAAEFYWLKNQRSLDPVVKAKAETNLMQLYNDLGLYAEAAAIAEALTLANFKRSVLKPESPTEASTAYALLQIGDQSPLGTAIARRSFPAYPISRINIRETRWTPIEKDVLDAFVQYRREFPLLPGSSFQLLDKGHVPKEDELPKALDTYDLIRNARGENQPGRKTELAESRVAVVDREAGVIRGKVNIPLRNSYPSLSKRAHVGHFFPVGSINRMSGVSLLEIENEEPLWKKKLGEAAAHEHLLRVGPAGPDFCTFQGRQELLMLDPATGKTLWKRSDIDPSSGLVSDLYAGLFGDDDVLVLFHANRSSYTVFNTMTGEDLHHGRLDIDTGQIRRIFGRKLFYIADTEAGRRMRIWDFLENRLVFDEPAGSRIYTALTPDHELVVLIPPEDEDEDQAQCRLKILDVVQDETLLDMAIPAEDVKSLNYIRAFRIGDTFYVNFQRSLQMPVERLFSYYASDAFPPVENVQGDLLAVEAATGEIRWKRRLPQRSILQMPNLRLPFLVMISRVRDRWQGGKQGLLVEVVDEATGETIAKKDNNLSDRVVNLAYDRDRGTLDLNGLKTRIRLSFGPAITRIPSADEPL